MKYCNEPKNATQLTPPPEKNNVSGFSIYLKNKIFLYSNIIMSSLNINNLYETMWEKNIKRYEKFDEILKKLHNRIKYNAKLEKTYCFFHIPQFIIGVPLYNIEDLKKYLFQSLQKDGFKYMYIEPNWLFISWEVKKSKHIPKRVKKEKKKGNYKLIDEYKPSGEFVVYNDYDISSMKQQMDRLL